MKSYVLLVGLLLSNASYGDIPSFDLLSRSQVNAISEEFSENFVHTTASPASSLGDIFGLEFGFILGASETPKVNATSKETDPDASIKGIPHMGFMAALSLPYGITGEMTFIPLVGGDIKFDHLSYALKYTLPSTMNIPFDVALRVHGSKSNLSYIDTVNNASTGNTDVSANLSFDMSSFGYHVVVSKDLIFLEPYLGIGSISTDTDIAASADSNVSIFNFSSASSFSSDNSGMHFFLGANVKLIFLKVGVEYSKVMDVDRYSVKTSIYF